MSINIKRQSTVEVQQHWGSDDFVVKAAQVSVKGANDPSGVTPEKRAGLIKHLVKMKHGVPFEHSGFTFYVQTPITVMRQVAKHRISSISEVSGRYRELENTFYVPPVDRPLVNTGSSARPERGTGTDAQFSVMEKAHIVAYERAWEAYQVMLKQGIWTEVARDVLPVGFMTEIYISVNLRSLMNFLAQRVDSEAALVRSHPMWEIEQVAEKMEEAFADTFPLTWQGFIDAGRVAP